MVFFEETADSSRTGFPIPFAHFPHGGHPLGFRFVLRKEVTHFDNAKPQKSWHQLFDFCRRSCNSCRGAQGECAKYVVKPQDRERPKAKGNEQPALVVFGRDRF